MAVRVWRTITSAIPIPGLADTGYHVVCYDQLGCGESDKPDDPALWALERYVREAETVRAAMGLGTVHLYGHSWGAWFGIEYALT